MDPVYDISKSCQWNQENGPLFTGQIPNRSSYPNPTKVWDFILHSPLGIPAGPLFNAKFIKLYSDLGFDTLTYKTVRSVPRKAHPNPNIVFVDTSQGIKPQMLTCQPPESIDQLTITNSYGINSLSIPDWQTDFNHAQKSMKEGQLLILSCMGTHGLAERDLVADYTYVASAAKDAGAKAIEINFSCPNLKGACAGAIFMDPKMSSDICRQVKQVIGSIPLIIKIGHYKNQEVLAEVLKANAPYIDGIAAINTVSTQVTTPSGEQALPGEGRLTSGLCGAGLKPFALETIRDIARLKDSQNYDFEILGMGGITTAKDIDQYLEAGATLAMTGAGSMWNPLMAYNYNQLHL